MHPELTWELDISLPEEEILKKWLDEGMELEDVAKRLRRTWWAVRVRASRLNIAVP